MSLANDTIAEPKTNGRSRITNGRTLLPGIDGRSTWYRRFRDLIGLHLSDIGGENIASEGEKAIVRRVATLIVEMERLEHQFADTGAASASDLDLYQRTSNTMRRHLEALGLQRRARDITSPLDGFIDADPLSDDDDEDDADDEPLASPERAEV